MMRSQGRTEVPCNPLLQDDILEFLAIPHPYSFIQLFVGKDEISSIVRVNVTNSSSSSVTKTSKCLNEGARFKRLHDVEMHSPRRQSVENAHIAFDVTSSNFYVKRSHQIRTTGRKGWIRCNPMDWQGAICCFPAPAFQYLQT